jgi:hypothetical protein
MTTIVRAALVMAALVPLAARAQGGPSKPSFEVYGFGMVDYIQDFKRMPGDWDATLRPTKIPVPEGSIGGDGQAIFSARQSRLGVRGSTPVGGADLKGRVEFDFYGRSGGGRPDAAGQDSIRLRRAYGEWGPVLGGLTDSLFMDDDYWPNIIDYWGPAGMVFYRNVQIRFTPYTGTHSFAVALERPGADLQAYPEDAPDLAADNKLPDLTARYRLTQNWGYLQLSGIVRKLGYENAPALGSGSALGWGLNASSTIKLKPDKVHLLLAVAGGEGVENYWNDAPVDIGIKNNLSNPVTPVVGKALPVLGVVAFLDLNWNAKWTSTVGYSLVNIDNSDAQAPDAYKRGQYALANILYYPAANFFLGPEIQWGKRENFKDGFTSDDVRIQFSVKYNFKYQLGGK